MKSVSEVLAKHDKGVRHYHNNSPYVRKGDALMAMREYANQFSIPLATEVDVILARATAILLHERDYNGEGYEETGLYLQKVKQLIKDSKRSD